MSICSNIKVIVLANEKGKNGRRRSLKMFGTQTNEYILHSYEIKSV